MDFQTARSLLISQGMASEQDTDALLTRLKQGKSPIPGQVTSILLALKIVFEELRDTVALERELACALHILAIESRAAFEAGKTAGVEWAPLLDEDLNRIAAAVKSTLTGVWQS